MLTAAVSGSFHRHMDEIARAVEELMALSVRVLSPADPRVVAAQGEFLFVASDRVRSVRLVQDRHLESIRAASFLWLVCPDGYVGQSASMEIGFAAGAGIPIYTTHLPIDLTLREYVQVVPSIDAAIQIAFVRHKQIPAEGILIDPHASIEEAHDCLQKLQAVLLGGGSDSESADLVHREMLKLQETVQLPTFVH